jgi:hypothetical protein
MTTLTCQLFELEGKERGGNGGLTEWSGVVKSIVINIVTQSLHVVLDGDLALACQLLDFLCAVLLPVLDVWVIADAERTALSSTISLTSSDNQ